MELAFSACDVILSITYFTRITRERHTDFRRFVIHLKKNFEKETRNETPLNFYKVLTILILLYGFKV